ncbi:MAG: single-stranded DNA-binding protein [Lachnospiraceae bacterium]|nr:single-stranded DNA-binding protein [Lachnospiraceae bacterium]
MNKVILVGRLTRDPNVSYSAGNEPRAVARYTLAVDRRVRRDSGSTDQPTADFISVVAFGRDGEFAEKYLRKGSRILVEGRIQTGSYTNKDGQKVYTTDVVVERHEFVDSKSSQGSEQFIPANDGGSAGGDSGDGFMNIPDGIDEELPFS